VTNLYDLMDEYQGLQDALEDEGATQEQVGALLDRIDEAKGSLQSKVDAICRVLKNLDAQATAIQTEEKRLKARRQARENSAETLRTWIKSSMDVLDVKSIKTDLFNVSLVEGPHAVRVLDENAIPDAYVKLKREPDKKLILKAFKEDGEIVAGTDVVRSVSLRVS
jgi:hypothetical protein